MRGVAGETHAPCWDTVTSLVLHVMLLVVLGCGGDTTDRRSGQALRGASSPGAQETVSRANGGKDVAWDVKVLELADSEGDLLLRAALRVAAAVSDANKRADLLLEIAAAQAEAGDVGAALRTAHVIQDDERKALAFVEASIAQAKAGDKEKALATLKRGRELLGKGWNNHAHRWLVALAYAGERQAALLQLEQIPFDESFEKIVVLLRIVGAGDDGGNGAQKDLLAKERAELLEATKGAGDDVVALTNIATLESALGNKRVAHDTLQKASEQVRGMPVGDRPMRFLAVAHAQGQVEGIETARPTLAEALADAQHPEFRWFQPVFLQELVRVQVNLGDIDGALGTVDSMRLTLSDSDGRLEAALKQSKAYCFAEIAIAQAKAGDRDAACRTFEHARQALSRRRQSDPAIQYQFSVIVPTIAEAMAMLGRHEEVVNLVSELEDPATKVTAFLAAYRGQRQSEDSD